jgi:hypothetical protein
MEREVIAEIRLAPGQVGYYDDYSRIYLSAAKPLAKIYAGTNTTQIRKSIRSGRLLLVSGSLFGKAPVTKEAPQPKPVKKEAVKEIKEEKKPEETIQKQEVIEEPAIVETAVEEIVIPEEVPEKVQEEVQEEVSASEDKPKRRRSRKKVDAE